MSRTLLDVNIVTNIRLQVSLQWAWATYLFTSPYYAQTACSPETNIVLFLVTMRAGRINHGNFGLWGSWLLFSISVTLLFGVLLVLSSTSGANGNREPKKVLRKPKVSRFTRAVKAWDPQGNKRRNIVFGFAVLICLMLVVTSEVQARKNCVFGENDTWGFGQIAALLFALAPLWSILESEGGHRLYTEGRRLYRKARGKHEGVAGASAPPPNSTSGHQRSGSHEALLPHGQSASPPPSPVTFSSLFRQHSRDPSDASSLGQRELLPQVSNSSLNASVNAHGRSASLLSEINISLTGDTPIYHDMPQPPSQFESETSGGLQLASPTIPSGPPALFIIPPSEANSRAPSIRSHGTEEEETHQIPHPSAGSLINLPPVPSTEPFNMF
ncbi:hypothetical protein HWV62_36761 [Athelia sp. TMB]|nr:hypothetical protein HWV62_36761 [Athelia sp. TMB]